MSGILSGIISAAGGTDTSDATATAADILTGKTAYGSAGSKLTGTLYSYTPPMMQFDGSKEYFSASVITSGNAFTVVMRVKVASQAGSGVQRLCLIDGPAIGGKERVFIDIGDAGNSDTDHQNRVRIVVKDDSNAIICRLFTNSVVADGVDHMLFVAFDATAGTALLIVDGESDINNGATNHVAPTTGTLDSGASSVAALGSGGGSSFVNGAIGFFGYRDAYLTNYPDFLDGNQPKEIDESGWTEWGSQPLFWNEYGQMSNNKGSAGDMTAYDVSTSPITETTIPIADY